MPRTFLVGESSLPDADAEKAAAFGIPVIEVPGAGHNLMLDNPDGFAAALARSLTEVPVDSADPVDPVDPADQADPVSGHRSA